MNTYENSQQKSSPRTRKRVSFPLAAGWRLVDDGIQWTVVDSRGGKDYAEFYAVEAETITQRLRQLGIEPTPEARERLSRLPMVHP